MSSFLRSFSIFSPVLCENDDERSIDNIIYHFPEDTAPALKLNHVGFCLSITYLGDKFGVGGCTSHEVQTEHGILSMFSPLENLWLVLEAKASQDGDVLLMLLQRSFQVFEFLNGPALSAALVRPNSDRMEEAVHAISCFYRNFTQLLDAHILPSLFPDPTMQKSTSVLPHANYPSPVWAEMLAYDALLGYPVQRFKSSVSLFLNMQSIAERLLSRASAAAAAGTAFTPHFVEKSSAVSWLHPTKDRAEAEETEGDGLVGGFPPSAGSSRAAAAGADYAVFELSTLRLLSSSLPSALLSVMKLNWLLRGLETWETDGAEPSPRRFLPRGGCVEVGVCPDPPILVVVLWPRVRAGARAIRRGCAAAIAKEVRALMAAHGRGPREGPVVGTCGLLEHATSPLEMAALANFTGDAHCRAVEGVHARLAEDHPTSSVGWLLWEARGGGLHGNAIRDLPPDTSRRLTRLMRRTFLRAGSGEGSLDSWAAIDFGIVHVSFHHQQVLGLVIQGLPNLQACLNFVERLREVIQ